MARQVTLALAANATTPPFNGNHVLCYLQGPAFMHYYSRG